jgi:SAM-dependent methyltransferase
MRLSTSAPIDEQALAERLAPAVRRERGAYFTPVEIVDQVLDAVAPFIPRGRVTFVDPACGAGAFLARAAQRYPKAQLLGLELEASSLALAKQRLPRATLLKGDALKGRALEKLLERSEGFEVWIGNPPYNGTSPLLKDVARWRELASRVDLAAGQSLREDYVFFLFRALERRPGALAFVTSATLLDSWAYAPVRKLLCESLALRAATPLGRAFRDTNVATCFTVWTREGERHVPAGPEFLLREPDAKAAALDAEWAARGARLSQLVPFSLPGLKTRFDELLVDDDRDALVERMKRFCAGEVIDVPHPAKLAALPRVPFDANAVRRFLHPRGRRAWCYVDRRLIPRGDHRFQGADDPHACDVKLAFSVRELPLWAQVFDEPGCVTAYRHTRFAPLTWRGKVNLSVPSDKPREAFEAIARFVMSEAVQTVWAPAFGTSRDLPVPFGALESGAAAVHRHRRSGKRRS